MRLIELTSNQHSFRTVRFNPTGLTLVVGKQSDPADKSRTHSTNGVGKSLLLYLVNFCLGAETNKQLKEKLPGWDFSLTIEINNSQKVLTRSTENQSWISVNGKNTSLRTFCREMGAELFGINVGAKHLSFRFLIAQFFRQGKPAYISEEKTFDRETPFQSQLRAAYLLGIDQALPLRKLELREERERLDTIRSQFKKDSFLRDYFQGDRDVALELTDLDEQISNLEKHASEFKVADNYDQLAIEAEETRRKWQRVRNDLNAADNALQQIAASLLTQPELSTETVTEMYRSAKVELPDSVVKNLLEVSNFHHNLIESRVRRLTSEKHDIERKIERLNEELKQLNRLKDEYFQFLGTHGALREYEAIRHRLGEFHRRADRLREFQSLEQECKERSQKNKLEMSQENIRATEYLKASKALLDSTNERFRLMARRIWPNHTCGLTIHNNEGENKVRFDIDVRIQGDASDGIGESKIFCFDMTVLLGQKNHKLKALMHDNRLYQGIDPRQCVELFRIAHDLTQASNTQYIATINEANLHAMHEKMESPDEFRSLFEENIVLELTDDSDSGKLLGVTVDLEYDAHRKRDK